MTDVPSTIMLIQYDDNIKVVVDRVKGPQELKQFEMEMRALSSKTHFRVFFISNFKISKNTQKKHVEF